MAKATASPDDDREAPRKRRRPAEPLKDPVDQDIKEMVFDRMGISQDRKVTPNRARHAEVLAVLMQIARNLREQTDLNAGLHGLEREPRK